MSAAHDAIIQNLLDTNPGIRFGLPDGFYGNRPVYFTDGPGQDARITARAWLMDPEGFSGRTQDFAGWQLTPAPPDKAVFGEPWLLPASTTAGNSPFDIVGSWGYADANGGTIWWDVLRAGYLVPNVQNPNAPLPPQWAIALTVYNLSDFHVGSSPSTTSTPPATQTTPGTVTSSGGGRLSSGGTPITGNPLDRFLVNGITYDGLGTIIARNATGNSSAHSVSSHSVSWFPVVLLVGAYALTHRHPSRR